MIYFNATTNFCILYAGTALHFGLTTVVQHKIGCAYFQDPCNNFILKWRNLCLLFEFPDWCQTLVLYRRRWGRWRNWVDSCSWRVSRCMPSRYIKVVWSHLHPCWYNFSCELLTAQEEHGTCSLNPNQILRPFPTRFPNYSQPDSQTIPNQIPIPFRTWLSNHFQPDSYTILNQIPKPLPRHFLRLTDLC